MKRTGLPLLLVFALVAGLAASGCMNRMSRMDGDAMMMSGERLTLMPTPLAANASLGGATGVAMVDVPNGMVAFTVNLPAGMSLPAGSVLEGWVVSAGSQGGPGMSSASERDQQYGPAFGEPAFASKSREIPYALSTGQLERGDGQTYTGHFQIANPLTPYGAVVVTLESDGNQGSYDPRPGTPVLQAMISP